MSTMNCSDSGIVDLPRLACCFLGLLGPWAWGLWGVCWPDLEETCESNENALVFLLDGLYLKRIEE